MACISQNPPSGKIFGRLTAMEAISSKMDSKKRSQPDSTDPPKKKKKARWRNQKKATLVVTQLAYDAGAEELAAHLAVDGRRPTIRLVADGASSEDAGRKHAGLACAVFEAESDADACRAAADGSVLLGHRLRVAPLADGHDDAGRLKAKKASKAEAPNTEARDAIEALAKKHGLADALDGEVKAALGRAPFSVAKKVCRDVQKKRELPGAEAMANPSAYALGVLKRAAREDDGGAPRLLEPDHVDHLVAAAIEAHASVLARADVDGRCRAYMTEFSEDDVRRALDDVAKKVAADRSRKQAAPAIKSVSAFLMGILRDVKRGVAPPVHKQKRAGRLVKLGKGGGKGRGKGRGRGRGGGRGRGRS